MIFHLVLVLLNEGLKLDEERSVRQNARAGIFTEKDIAFLRENTLGGADQVNLVADQNDRQGAPHALQAGQDQLVQGHVKPGMEAPDTFEVACKEVLEGRLPV